MPKSIKISKSMRKKISEVVNRLGGPRPLLEKFFKVSINKIEDYTSTAEFICQSRWIKFQEFSELSDKEMLLLITQEAESIYTELRKTKKANANYCIENIKLRNLNSGAPISPP